MPSRFRKRWWVAVALPVACGLLALGLRSQHQSRYRQAFAPLEGNRYAAVMELAQAMYVPDGFRATEDQMDRAVQVAANNKGRRLRLTDRLNEPIAMPVAEASNSTETSQGNSRAGSVYLAAALVAAADGRVVDAARARLDLLRYAGAVHRGGLLAHAMFRQRMESQALNGLVPWIDALAAEERAALRVDYERILQEREPTERFLEREALWAGAQMAFGENPIAWFRQRLQLSVLYKRSREKLAANEPMFQDVRAAFALVEDAR